MRVPDCQRVEASLEESGLDGRTLLAVGAALHARAVIDHHAGTVLACQRVVRPRVVDKHPDKPAQVDALRIGMVRLQPRVRQANDAHAFGRFAQGLQVNECLLRQVLAADHAHAMICCHLQELGVNQTHGNAAKLRIVAQKWFEFLATMHSPC